MMSLFRADASPEDMKSGPGPHDGLSDFGKVGILLTGTSRVDGVKH